MTVAGNLKDIFTTSVAANDSQVPRPACDLPTLRVSMTLHCLLRCLNGYRHQRGMMYRPGTGKRPRVSEIDVNHLLG